MSVLRCYCLNIVDEVCLVFGGELATVGLFELCMGKFPECVANILAYLSRFEVAPYTCSTSAASLKNQST